MLDEEDVVPNHEAKKSVGKKGSAEPSDKVKPEADAEAGSSNGQETASETVNGSEPKQSASVLPTADQNGAARPGQAEPAADVKEEADDMPPDRDVVFPLKDVQVKERDKRGRMILDVLWEVGS